MALESTGRVHVHVHVPQQEIRPDVEPIHNHIHLYLHPAAFGAEETIPTAPRGRPFLKIAVVLLIIGLPAAYWLAHESPTSVADASLHAAGHQERTLDRTEPQAMPRALVQQLATAPRVIPPPGSGAAAPTGPAAFGLGN